MALVKKGERESVSKWSQRDKRATRHKLPEDAEKPLINYTRLRELISIDGLADRDNPESTAEAHEEFMLNYQDMFVKPAKKRGLPFHSMDRCTQKSSEMSLLSKSAGDKTTTTHRHRLQKKYPADELSHNIGDHLGALHRERKRDHPADVKSDRLKTIRRLLKKLPFERSAVENDQLFACLKQFDCISSQVSLLVLKELCVMAYLDEWKESEVTVFGNTGWHLILKGSVKPQTTIYHKIAGEEMEMRSPTPELGEDDAVVLGVGDCFGTLDKVEERSPNSRILTVLTNEANCDFLKISCNDYKRVIEQIHHRDRTEKVNLLQSCDTFELWSRQPLMEVASFLIWSTYPANTILVSEGYKAPFLGVIKTGECHILRQVEVKNTLPNGTQERKIKQVVMGKLGTSQSFGEISCIDEVPMSCSIITATACEIGCVHLDKVKELNETTRQLLHQSSVPTFGDLGPDDIHEEYVQQELKREWNEFKHNVVVDVINHRGIRPGYGKWAKS